MGFYAEIEKSADGEYVERSFPPVFWLYFSIAGFALTCMGLAAWNLLKDLFSHGDLLDVLLVIAISSAVPLYVVLGLYLFGVRKYIGLKTSELEIGYYFRRWKIIRKLIKMTEIERIQLINQVPSPNRAPIQHDDSQYFIRGHWRLSVRLQSGKTLTLDKHTEKEVLEPLFKEISDWLRLRNVS